MTEQERDYVFKMLDSREEIATQYHKDRMAMLARAHKAELLNLILAMICIILTMLVVCLSITLQRS